MVCYITADVIKRYGCEVMKPHLTSSPPYVVAASAIAGKIVEPYEFLRDVRENWLKLEYMRQGETRPP